MRTKKKRKERGKPVETEEKKQEETGSNGKKREEAGTTGKKREEKNGKKY